MRLYSLSHMHTSLHNITKMKSSRILVSMLGKRSSHHHLLLFLLLALWLSPSKCERQTGENTTPPGSLCVSHCNTCPIICSPPQSTEKLPPPPPKHHHHDDSPPPVHPARPPPSSGGAATAPPPPKLYEYEPGVVQQNLSYPYYYFYTSQATSGAPPNKGYCAIFSMLFMLFQALLVC